MKKNHETDLASMLKGHVENMSENKLLWISLGAVGVSFILKAYKQERLATTVRQWAIPLVMGGLMKQASKVIGAKFS